jgi:Domain of unknown function (DUF4191)
MVLRKKSSAADSARPAAAKTPRRAGDPAEKQGRFAQVAAVYKLTRQRDPRVTWIALLGLLGPLAVGVVLGLFIGQPWLWIPIGLVVGLVVAMNLFSRRVQKTAYAEMEGRPGVAAGIVERMRGEWRVVPAVQVNRNQDLVHRVVGRPGIILIAEGRGRGPRELLGNEVRRLRRVVGDTPVRDIVVGTGEGEIPLPKLQSTLMRMPRALRKRDIEALDRRLKAVGGPALPVPKGPLPRNIPRGNRIR